MIALRSDRAGTGRVAERDSARSLGAHARTFDPLPGLGAIALGGRLGVQLGDSAVGQINPIYFQGAAGPSARPRRGDRPEQPAPADRLALQPDLWLGAGPRGARGRCGGVRRIATRADADAGRASARRRRSGRRSSTPAAQPWPVEHVSARIAEIERYARYPITRSRPSPRSEPRTSRARRSGSRPVRRAAHDRAGPRLRRIDDPDPRRPLPRRARAPHRRSSPRASATPIRRFRRVTGLPKSRHRPVVAPSASASASPS